MFSSLFLFSFRILILIFIFSGISLYIYQKFEIRVYFLPICTISFISLIMYISGLLNCMPLSVFLICCSGFYKLIVSLHDNNWLLISKKILLDRKPVHYPLFIFLCLLIYLVYYCKNGLYPDGDTMTHWGVIVREMYELNRLPNFSTLEVAYQSYPPGTACFLYFVCAVAGYSESITMIAQALILSMFL